ncbi:hypothetical protein BIW11_04310 [Tropilaelaps mercedesae]|uniref:Uncharacterized protein n=1 Tax=Tropilaelaps mercedesae TaxID=418985 RepID=A0A1V9X831_9ACAR|nr:hypothetical protein BIW11_04310 [Tropilaelaps mercedesae]
MPSWSGRRSRKGSRRSHGSRSFSSALQSLMPEDCKTTETTTVRKKEEVIIECENPEYIKLLAKELEPIFQKDKQVILRQRSLKDQDIERRLRFGGSFLGLRGPRLALPVYLLIIQKKERSLELPAALHAGVREGWWEESGQSEQDEALETVNGLPAELLDHHEVQKGAEIVTGAKHRNALAEGHQKRDLGETQGRLEGAAAGLSLGHRNHQNQRDIPDLDSPPGARLTKNHMECQHEDLQGERRRLRNRGLYAHRPPGSRGLQKESHLGNRDFHGGPRVRHLHASHHGKNLSPRIGLLGSRQKQNLNEVCQDQDQAQKNHRKKLAAQSPKCPKKTTCLKTARSPTGNQMHPQGNPSQKRKSLR